MYAADADSSWWWRDVVELVLVRSRSCGGEEIGVDPAETREIWHVRKWPTDEP